MKAEKGKERLLPFNFRFVKFLFASEVVKILLSQETLVDDENEFRIRLKVKITHDFVSELLSQSDMMKASRESAVEKAVKSRKLATTEAHQ